MSDTDDLLDMTLDDLEDLPTNDPFTPGAHRMLMSMEVKDINGKKPVEASFTMMETMELANPLKEGETASVPGDKTSILCFFDNEWGRGTFKLLAKPVGERLGIANNREIVEQCNDIEVVAVTFLSYDKKNDVHRMKVKTLEVV